MSQFSSSRFLSQIENQAHILTPVEPSEKSKIPLGSKHVFIGKGTLTVRTAFVSHPSISDAVWFSILLQKMLC